MEENTEFTVPAKFAGIVAEVEKLSVVELNELVKVFEVKWGVSATAVAVEGPAAEAGEEKSEFTVVLAGAGENKIAVMEGIKKEEAEALKKQLEEAGASVELK